MIIGRGLLGNSLLDIDDNKYLFCANGISNSVLHQIPRNNFEIKEIEEIARQSDGKTFIYFSTSQVNSKANHDRAYVKHKLYLENFIAGNFANYLIVRTTNLVGNNPWNMHTLFNYLHHAITVNQQITVNPVLERNFLDVSHFISLLKKYLENYERNKIVEIVNPVSFTMGEMVYEFENYYSKKFNVEMQNAATDFAVFELNRELSVELFESCHLSTLNYIARLLKKYYKDVPIVPSTGSG